MEKLCNQKNFNYFVWTLVSTIRAKLVEKLAASVVDTSGNFAATVTDTATGVVETGDAPWLADIYLATGAASV
jgi:hypothetical protein